MDQRQPVAESSRTKPKFGCCDLWGTLAHQLSYIGWTLGHPYKTLLSMEERLAHLVLEDSQVAVHLNTKGCDEFHAHNPPVEWFSSLLARAWTVKVVHTFKKQILVISQKLVFMFWMLPLAIVAPYPVRMLEELVCCVWFW